jgi:excisionase family DNA binding protein
MEPPANLLSPAQLAEFLGVPISTVYKWNSEHSGPSPLVVGRHRRYRIEDVNEWLTSCERGDLGGAAN